MTGRYNTGPESLSEIIASLSKRVAALESGNQVGFTSIDTGALNVTSGILRVGNPTTPAVYFGPVSDGFNTAQGFIFRRANGNTVFDLQGSLSAQFWVLLDDSGNNIISDDTVSEQGIARPYIPINYGVHYNKTIAVTTTSGTFEGMWLFRFKKQQPKVVIDPLFKCSDGTTAGEYQVVNNLTSEVIVDPTVISAGLVGRLPTADFAVSGFHMQDCELELQVRRTAGAGSIGVEIYNAYGRQT